MKKIQKRVVKVNRKNVARIFLALGLAVTAMTVTAAAVKTASELNAASNETEMLKQAGDAEGAIITFLFIYVPFFIEEFLLVICCHWLINGKQIKSAKICESIAAAVSAAAMIFQILVISEAIVFSTVRGTNYRFEMIILTEISAIIISVILICVGRLKQYRYNKHRI